MLDYKKVQEYIEKKNNVKLPFTQVQILKAIIRGDIIYTARGIGRSFLYNGYADYLKEVIGKDTDRTLASTEFDSIFTIETMKHNDFFKGQKLENVWNKIKEDCPDRFNKEFMCEFKR